MRAAVLLIALLASTASAIQWSHCDITGSSAVLPDAPRIECASIAVPQNWLVPRNATATITIFVQRIAVTRPEWREGMLLILPDAAGRALTQGAVAAHYLHLWALTNGSQPVSQSRS